MYSCHHLHYIQEEPRSWAECQLSQAINHEQKSVMLPWRPLHSQLAGK